jgi:hypothetical protein
LPPLLPIAAGRIHGTLQAGEVVLPAGTMRNAHLELRGDPTAMEVDLATAEMQTDQVVLRDATGHLHIVSQVGTGTLRAGRADLRRISATDLGGDLSITGRQMTLSNMHGKAYNGTLQGGAKVDLGDPAAPHSIDFDASE